MRWSLAIDVGGTFTDIVAQNEAGERLIRKTPSTPDDFSVGFARGIEETLTAVGATDGDIATVAHGTTVATNAIIEARYARVGLIVNRGYREMLECARQLVPGDFGDISWWIKPPRVVPLELVREVEGRLDAEGEQVRPVDEDGVRALAAEYRDLGIAAVAVSLLHSYRNPEHEQRVRELLLEVYPECHVSISSEIIKEYREYERTLSTCLNTGLMPMVSSYVDRLRERTKDSVGAAPLYVMKSSGGVSSTREFVERPIGAVLSGPAAGVIAAAQISAALGYENVITFDVGGTSADIALIEDGAPRIRSEGKIDIYDLKMPMIEMTAVGAGGGSIAWLSASGSLRVGPQSAGSKPGPACYGRGGEEPTVTDAHLVLGRVPDSLLDGGMSLDLEAAEKAIGDRIAAPLGLSVEEAANAILEIAIQNMAAGTRLVSIRQGRDPRGYALYAFGGAGGLHAVRIAEALGMETIVVPAAPGAGAAEGLLLSDFRLDEVLTDVQREDELDVERVIERVGTLRETVAAELAREGFQPEETSFEVFFDLRYSGQAYELRVEAEADGLDPAAAVRAAIAGFHAAHEDNFGFSYAGTALVELVNVGVTGRGLFAQPAAGAAGDGGPRAESWEGALKTTRPVFDRAAGELVATPIYDRFAAPTGTPLPGPAVIEQYDTTVVVEPGWTVASDGEGHLVISRSADKEDGR